MRTPRHHVTPSPHHLVTLVLFMACLSVYVRTAAPSVLSGDSAEFQLAAVLLGVPHPTTYPLYTLLGKLATLIIPFYDLARRVTLVSSGAAALAVALMLLLARRVTGGTWSALLAALALAVAPGLWNAATLAEVYALLALLLVALGYALLADCRLVLSEAGPAVRHAHEPQSRRVEGSQIVDYTNREPRTMDDGRWTMDGREPTTDDRGRKTEDGRPAEGRVPRTEDRWLEIERREARTVGRSHTKPHATRPLLIGAFIAGLGFSHHGLFVFTGLPLFAGYVVWQLGIRGLGAGGRSQKAGVRRQEAGVRRQAAQRRSLHTSTPPHLHGSPLRQLLTLTLAFALGLTPWLYPLVQYARYGPFVDDYGLPTHYFWGAPGSWGAAVSLLFGGRLREGVFRIPGGAELLATLHLLSERLWFEFGPLGCALGLVGCVVLFIRQRGVWLGAAWVFGATGVYLLLLGPAVQDAPVFTLPMLLPWALWVGLGAQAIGDVRLVRTEDGRPTTGDGGRTAHPVTRSPGHLLALVFLAATLAWGYTRAPYSNKRHLWLYRQWGEATLQRLPPQSVVITHWEQGMALQYLILAEQQRPDVWVDVVEPGDAPWGERAARRYPEHPVFLIGTTADVAGLPVELIDDTPYADLFRLR